MITAVSQNRFHASQRQAFKGSIIDGDDEPIKTHNYTPRRKDTSSLDETIREGVEEAVDAYHSQINRRLGIVAGVCLALTAPLLLFGIHDAKKATQANKVLAPATDTFKLTKHAIDTATHIK